ncbi:MAG: hypothetical protein ACI8UO_005769 [Verrucomicrobiales bacterium]
MIPTLFETDSKPVDSVFSALGCRPPRPHSASKNPESFPHRWMPYRLLIEIDQPNDDQPSLVYSVEIDNADPRAFQLLDLVGYPKREEDDKDGKEVWALYYVDYTDERFGSVLEMIDSALMTIDRDQEGSKN